MDSFDIICEIDEEIFEVFKKNFNEIKEFSSNSSIPNTINATLAFISKSNYIKEGLFDLYESKNFYGFRILLRSLVEHFLRFQYIFHRTLVDKNDDVGIEYFKFCSLSESIDTSKAWKAVSVIIGENSDLDPYEILKNINPDFNKYSRNEIEQKSSAFRYKTIIRYLNKAYNKDGTFESNKFILKLIPQYSDLSSYVHGGPDADVSLTQKSYDELANFMISDVAAVFQITSNIKEFTFFLLSQHDGKFGKGYEEINRLINKASDFFNENSI